MKIKKNICKTKPRKLSFTQSNEKVELGYDNDFFKWTKTQANLMKKGLFDKLDTANLIEEIESLGRNDKRSLRSYTIVLLMHLLKQKYQAGGKGNSDSWQSSVRNATREIQFLLQDSPSLKTELLKLYEQAYEVAKEEAAIETKLPLKTFPQECPWKIEEILPFINKKIKK